MAIEDHISESDNWFIGEDKSLIFTVYQADGITPQNITGWALEWDLRKTDADATAVLTKTTASGIALTTPTSGVCTVTIADTDTDTLDPGTYRHALKRTTADSETILTYGNATIKQAAVR